MGEGYERMIEELGRCRRVIVTTHVRPDGDAIGCCAAMVLAMRQKGIEADTLLLSHLPRKYAFVYQDTGLPHIDVEKGWPADLTFGRYDAVLVVDTGTRSQLPGVLERLEGYGGRKLVIDHHLTQEGWADARVVVKEAAAAGEIVAELLERWGVRLDASIALALYVAIVTDTGWFAFSNTRPETLRLAARLMEAGVDTDRVYQLVYQNERPARFLLQTRAQQSLELLMGDRLAVMTLRKRDFEETGANVPDTENLINLPLQIASVEVSMLITEPIDDGAVRVSLRSKGHLDVARFAERFGGGGHRRASGLRLEMPLEQARQRVIEAMVEQMS